MNIYNSLGSNYSSSYIKKSRRPSPKDSSTKLRGVISRHYNADSVTLTYKGREALYLILKNLELPTHGLIAINGYTCFAVYDAIVAAGFTPYYIDIEKDKLNFSARSLDRALRKEKAIVAVIIQNTLGYPVEIDNISAICKAKKVPLIEDLAHSIGLVYDNHKEAGTVGDAAALSFSQDKVIDAVSGGAVVWRGKTNLKAQLASIGFSDKFKDRIYPSSTSTIRKTHNMFIGKALHKLLKKTNLLSKPMDGDPAFPHKMTNWHSNLALDSIENLNKTLVHRKKIAAIYKKYLPSEIQLSDIEHATYIRFPIILEKRKDLVAHLKSQDVFVSDIWYEAPISPGYCMPETNYDSQCPNSEYISRRMLNLPTHVNVNEKQARGIAELVTKWYKSNHAKS